jgi:hypothetical protein
MEKASIGLWFWLRCLPNFGKPTGICGRSGILAFWTMQLEKRPKGEMSYDNNDEQKGAGRVWFS